MLKKTGSRSSGTEDPTTLRSHHLHVNEQSLPPCEDTDDPRCEIGEAVLHLKPLTFSFSASEIES